eukprot:3877780-Ditylum_brightwellii.AAC.1
MSVGQEHAIVIPESKSYVTFHEDNFVEDTFPNNEARTLTFPYFASLSSTRLKKGKSNLNNYEKCLPSHQWMMRSVKMTL